MRVPDVAVWKGSERGRKAYSKDLSNWEWGEERPVQSKKTTPNIPRGKE